MSVLWIGMNDENACTRNWHGLRLALRDLGATVVGPGYTWPDGGVVKMSDILREHGEHDWVVYDDANALGYAGIILDVRPSGKTAWREHDWWNRNRQEAMRRWNPDRILSTYDRPVGGTLPHGEPDTGRSHPDWNFVPHAVDCSRFHPNGPYRDYALGFYGKHGAQYRVRTLARSFIAARMAARGDVWIGTHGGYWHDGVTHDDGRRTFYNDNLANALRRVRMLWVDGLDYQAPVLKFFEGAASGCVLIGRAPYAWERLFPEDILIDCGPQDVDDVTDSLLEDDERRQALSRRTADYCLKHHSLEVRAKEIMELLT